MAACLHWPWYDFSAFDSYRVRCRSRSLLGFLHWTRKYKRPPSLWRKLQLLGLYRRFPSPLARCNLLHCEPAERLRWERFGCPARSRSCAAIPAAGWDWLREVGDIGAHHWRNASLPSVVAVARKDNPRLVRGGVLLRCVPTGRSFSCDTRRRPYVAVIGFMWITLGICHRCGKSFGNLENNRIRFMMDPFALVLTGAAMNEITARLGLSSR